MTVLSACGVAGGSAESDHHERGDEPVHAEHQVVRLVDELVHQEEHDERGR